MKTVECNNLTKFFFRKAVLNQLSFSLEENKITGLIGRNGVGKTTLLKMIAGFIKETSGELKVFSQRPFNSLNVSSNTIFVDDQMSFPPALQLYELLEVSSKFYPNWDMDLAQRLFDYFSFDPRNYHKRLSKGKKSTFNAIVGIAARAPLTIFDEPTTGMDTAVRKDFYRALLKDYLARPRTIILSSHHLEEMGDLLEDILLLKDGQVKLHMPMEEFKEWAIALKGSADLVLEWAKGRELIYKNNLGVNSIYAVMKNDFLPEELMQAKEKGIDISTVQPSDLCIYLTASAKSKEGIDHVFHHR
ncbi:ATP-binding cassette domain-containing protein [Bacillus benzoevorans]|uniref:ABC-2 type transport system ATP-binding protein n=1 Tax=Bacillus benzoevorans TaxID=1456 RepID=A0A7X0LY08_9BACI|nr:ABC transporter ATP-binding protein [Bacillus benzoevorans]MBB6447027.1 ABC-2 type transport system ATP-binding protein [Bacillus benzoevorans]